MPSKYRESRRISGRLTHPTRTLARKQKSWPEYDYVHSTKINYYIAFANYVFFGIFSSYNYFNHSDVFRVIANRIQANTLSILSRINLSFSSNSCPQSLRKRVVHEILAKRSFFENRTKCRVLYFVR